jgi:hypothetical protein
MDDFSVLNNGKVTLITCEAKDFTMQAEKNRRFTMEDNAAFLEATLYREAGSFMPECTYVFQVISNEKMPAVRTIDIELCRSAVDFFFHSILSTTYFVTSIPPASKLYAAPHTTIENINDIYTSNLYNLLSGY